MCGGTINLWTASSRPGKEKERKIAENEGKAQGQESAFQIPKRYVYVRMWSGQCLEVGHTAIDML